ncbi:hypothetical protein C446_05160 [Halobiforma nitratireducens JCM 10879]|uniref:Uncharacterized protein n=1 Tax=Halobiforma nitratireducens JCM 10879 TaxID=1227454 RepID=M0M787_9EURY|nr:hypothetical protein C446_05160 [Halobiforma nitratireducens JCM 10879]
MTTAKADDPTDHGSLGEGLSPSGGRRYVAVVDRIVDGQHVVLLLEEDCELVDQLVVSVDEFETVEEGDIMVVRVDDGELLAYRIVPERPCGE